MCAVVGEVEGDRWAFGLGEEIGGRGRAGDVLVQLEQRLSARWEAQGGDCRWDLKELLKRV